MNWRRYDSSNFQCTVIIELPIIRFDAIPHQFIAHFRSYSDSFIHGMLIRQLCKMKLKIGANLNSFSRTITTEFYTIAGVQPDTLSRSGSKRGACWADRSE